MLGYSLNRERQEGGNKGQNCIHTVTRETQKLKSSCRECPEVLKGLSSGRPDAGMEGSGRESAHVQ